MTVAEALSRPDGQEWKQAMTDEMKSFEENDTWELVDLPSEGTAVECKWVYKIKCSSDNGISHRARLVAKGFTQREGIDYTDTFAPVVRHSTLRLLVALDEVLLKLDYEKSKLEPCLYTKKHNDYLTLVALYVDDFFIFSNNNERANALKQCLSLEFKIKDLGEAKRCLGVRITRDYCNNVITLDQENYIDQILKTFNMANCKSVNTPMDSNICLDDYENSKNDSCDKNVPYKRLIGSLMYLAVLTRPDIAYSVSFLSQYNNCYSQFHWKCAKRVLRYLKGTKSYVLKFSENNQKLERFADADWGSNGRDRKSYTGFLFKLSGAAVAWESKKQKTVALSTTEAEYMALSEASKEAIYFKNSLYELLDYDDCCIVIFNDN